METAGLTAPELLPFAGFANWDAYEDSIYAVYLETVAHARLTFCGHPVNVRFHPESKRKGYGFWHLITEAPSQDNRNEDDRLPDLKRCERVRWVAWCIQNAEAEGFSWWENRRQGETHVVIWAEAYDYAVVLAKRTSRHPHYYLLKTAYCLHDRTIRKFTKERDAWRKAQKD